MIASTAFINFTKNVKIDINEDHVLIHGAGSLDSDAAQETMEVYKANSSFNGLITDSISWNIGKLSVFSYSSFLDGDSFVVTGGIEINSGSGIVTNDIEYINVTKMFTDPPINATFLWDYPCITRYDAFSTDAYLDDYLLEQQELRFEVLSDSNANAYSMFITGNGPYLTLDFLLSKNPSNNMADIHCTAFAPQNFGGTFENEHLDEISKSTNIDMTGNITVLWAKWENDIWYDLFICNCY